jgi:hypothetical protein
VTMMSGQEREVGAGGGGEGAGHVDAAVPYYWY